MASKHMYGTAEEQGRSRDFMVTSFFSIQADDIEEDTVRHCHHTEILEGSKLSIPL